MVKSLCAFFSLILMSYQHFSPFQIFFSPNPFRQLTATVIFGGHADNWTGATKLPTIMAHSLRPGANVIKFLQS
jgi:hypothetical protein